MTSSSCRTVDLSQNSGVQTRILNTVQLMQTEIGPNYLPFCLFPNTSCEYMLFSTVKEWIKYTITDVMYGVKSCRSGPRDLILAVCTCYFLFL